MRLPMPEHTLSNALHRLVALAFERRALNPEIYRDRAWLAVGSNASVAIIPQSQLIFENAHLFAHFPQNSIDIEDRENPMAERMQAMLDHLEKHLGAVCVTAQLLDETWVGRCSTRWMNCDDETDWHQADTEEALVWELIDAYGDSYVVKDFRPEITS